ncbi:MAG TPA: 50S ribosomal protein L21 [Bacteroidia bacterium]|jgi:large subunit ribosomal protein L21|nr:50S ribosomal protein L21 [Bacteroidia bacterium]
MYAIVEIGGQQHKVEKDQRLYVNRLEAAEGANLEFDKVMLVDKDGNVTVGIPFVDGTRVAAQVVAHVKDDKVHIFKHKRRKGYRRFNGHRQSLTELFIQGILAKGETFKADSVKKVVKKAKAAPVAEVDTEVETAPKKKAATKKAAPKAEETEAPKAKKTTKKAPKKGE